MKLSSSLFAVLATAGLAAAQAPPDSNYERQQIYPSYATFRAEIDAIVAISEQTARTAALDGFWNGLLVAGQVPYAQGNQYAFLFRGKASSASWRGDFNNWNQSAGTKFAGIDLWIQEGSLSPDARTDYKIFLNSSAWILDPANPLQMWSGFGPNSELRMTECVFPRETVRDPQSPTGTLTGNATTASTNLGYEVNYRVYTPAAYKANNLAELPVVYVTDGHEYLADHLGSMVITLDNLIGAGRLKPTMAVFIDPRDPGNLINNRRLAEYNMNPKFSAFVADELVPIIDSKYRTNASAAGRVILGTSLGGLNAAYFGSVRPNVFHKIAVQSPAFNVNPAIYNLYRNQDLQSLEIYMTSGTLANDQASAAEMAKVLTSGGYDFEYLKTNDGHSWGNWRALIAETLINLIGPPTTQGDYNGDGIVDSADFTVWLDTRGSTDDLRADGDGNNVVNQADHDIWKESHGNSAAASTNLPATSKP